MKLPLIDVITLLVYLSGVLAIGVHFGRRNTSTEEYFLGGRQFAGWVVGLSLVGTSISSVTFLAYPADGFKTAWLRYLPNLMLPLAALLAAEGEAAPDVGVDEEEIPAFAEGGWVGPARSVAKGATFAFNDELEGLARMVLSGQISRDAYQREVSKIRAQQQAYEEANPLKSVGYEMAGAVLPALIPGGQGASAGRIASLAAKYPRAASLGTVLGESALYGAGSANSMRDIPRAMGEEAAFGFGMYGAGEAGKKAYQKFKARRAR